MPSRRSWGMALAFFLSHSRSRAPCCCCTEWHSCSSSTKMSTGHISRDAEAQGRFQEMPAKRYPVPNCHHCPISISNHRSHPQSRPVSVAECSQELSAVVRAQVGLQPTQADPQGWVAGAYRRSTRSASSFWAVCWQIQVEWARRWYWLLISGDCPI